MLFNFLLVLLLGTFAVLVAYSVNRRRTDSPSVPQSSLPVQIDRRDFEKPEKKWLLAFFSSESCSSCRTVRNLLKNIQANTIHIQEINFPKDRELHTRYGIDSVPIILIIDSDGVVTWSFAGTPSSALISDAISNL